MGEDRSRRGVGPQVAVAVGGKLVRQLDYLQRRALDLERDLDRRRPRLVDFSALPRRLDERDVGVGVALDQLLAQRAQAARLQTRLGRTVPLRGQLRHLLEEGRGKSDHGGSRRPAGGSGLGRSQCIEEPRGAVFRRHRSPACVWR